MQDDRFEWSDAKARANLRKHQISFEVARSVFNDPAMIDRIDDRDDYGEDRFNAIGMVRGELLTVTFYGTRSVFPYHLCQEGDTT